MSKQTSGQRIVVIGGGYAGALAAVRLAGRARGRAAVTLVEPRVELVQRLRLHQLATGQPVRGFDLSRLTGRRVENLRGRAVAVDPDRGAVAIERDGRLAEVPFDQAVIAVGSGIDLDAVPGVAAHAHSLAGPDAAVRLREALRLLRPDSRVAVCGAGLTGIEMASELAGARPDLRVSLVSAGRVGSGLSERGGEELRRRLERLGVELLEGEAIGAVEPGAVTLARGAEVEVDLSVWCGGFAASPLARDSGLPVDARGLLAVDATLRSIGHPNVIGAGDAAAIPAFPNGARYRMTCQAGMPSGAHAADTAVAALKGEEPEPFDFGYIHQPLSLGRRDGLIQWVDRADRPKDKVLVGRRAALYKELVTRSAVPSIRWERRFPGALRWPRAGTAPSARGAVAKWGKRPIDGAAPRRDPGRMSISATQPISPEEERLRAPRPVSRVILTREGERMLRAELDRLRQRLDGEFTERLREAHAFGASHENDEYLQIKEEEAVLASRIRQLESLLDSAEIIDEESASRGIVAIGSSVEVKDLGSGAVRKHRITGGFEPAEPGDVSANSPVGQALLGRVPEEAVEVELPNGRTVAFEVVAAEPAAPMARPGRA